MIPVPKDTPLAAPRIEARPEGTPIGDELPWPLAEIAARSPREFATSTVAPRSPECRREPRRRGSRAKRATLPPGSVIVGTLAGLNDAGEPLVLHRLDPSGRPSLARSTVPLGVDQVDQEVAVAFEGGDLRKPIILGVLWRPVDTPRSSPPPRTNPDRPPVEEDVDADRLIFAAADEIVLRCGKSSITLTRAGKVLIRGTYLLIRSSGVNRIKGGSVQLN